MIAELDFAKTRHTKLQQAKEDEKQKLISGQLKPKGHLLLNK
jgi:Mitoribosomal protein mL52